MICVGGSVAGAACAAFLARAGLRVLVVDRAAFPRHKACGEGVLPHGVSVLRRLGASVDPGAPTRGIRFTAGGRSSVFGFPGVGAGVRSPGEAPAGDTQRSRSPEKRASPRSGSARTRGEEPFFLGADPARATPAGRDDGLPPPGWGLAVSRFVLDEAVRARARDLGASFLEARVSRVEAGERGRPSVERARLSVGLEPDVPPGRVVTDRGEFFARVLVGADGVHSIFHRDLGLRTREVGSRVGLSLHVSGFEADPELVEVAAFPGGEVYIAPLSGRRAGGFGPGSTVDSQLRPLEGGDPSPGLTLVAFLVDRGLGLGPGDVMGFLRRLFPARASRARAEREVLGSAPLWRQVDRVAGPGWLLVGDAAGSIDPISGEGLSTALVGAEIAGEVLPRVLAGEGSMAEYAARLRAFKRPVERLTRLLLLLSSRPAAARWVLRREMGPSALMRVATGEMGFGRGLVRAVGELV